MATSSHGGCFHEEDDRSDGFRYELLYWAIDCQFCSVLFCSVPRLGAPSVAGRSLSIHMAQIAFGVDDITHPLLEHLDLRKTAVTFALPQGHAVEQDLEVATGVRMQIDRAQLLAEGGEQLLGHPGGAQQPVALAAVVDIDDRFAHGNS